MCTVKDGNQPNSFRYAGRILAAFILNSWGKYKECGLKKPMDILLKAQPSHIVIQKKISIRLPPLKTVLMFYWEFRPILEIHQTCYSLFHR